MQGAGGSIASEGERVLHLLHEVDELEDVVLGKIERPTILLVVLRRHLHQGHLAAVLLDQPLQLLLQPGEVAGLHPRVHRPAGTHGLRDDRLRIREPQFTRLGALEESHSRSGFWSRKRRAVAEHGLAPGGGRRGGDVALAHGARGVALGVHLHAGEVVRLVAVVDGGVRRGEREGGVVVSTHGLALHENLFAVDVVVVIGDGDGGDVAGLVLGVLGGGLGRVEVVAVDDAGEAAAGGGGGYFDEALPAAERGPVPDVAPGATESGGYPDAVGDDEHYDVAALAELVERGREVDVARDEEDGGRGRVVEREQKHVHEDGLVRRVLLPVGHVDEVHARALAALADLLGEVVEVAVGREHGDRADVRVLPKRNPDVAGDVFRVHFHGHGAVLDVPQNGHGPGRPRRHHLLLDGARTRVVALRSHRGSIHPRVAPHGRERPQRRRGMRSHCRDGDYCRFGSGSARQSCNANNMLYLLAGFTNKERTRKSHVFLDRTLPEQN